MFRGNHPARVDEKGRLKLPADFKSELEGAGEGKQVFYITSKDGKRAEIWPLKAWEEVEANLKKIPNMNPAKQKFLDVTSYYGQMVEMDAQGRLLIPQKLRDTAKVMGDVNVMGFQTMLEVVKEEMLDAQVKNAEGVVELTNTDLMAFAEKTKVAG